MRTVCVVMLSVIFAIILTGCAILTAWSEPPKPTYDARKTWCRVFIQIPWSNVPPDGMGNDPGNKADTDETIIAVKAHNKVWLDNCAPPPGTPPKPLPPPLPP